MAKHTTPPTWAQRKRADAKAKARAPLTYRDETLLLDGTAAFYPAYDTLPKLERDLLGEFIVEACNTYDATRDELTLLRRELINTKLAMRNIKVPKNDRR